MTFSFQNAFIFLMCLFFINCTTSVSPTENTSQFDIVEAGNPPNQKIKRTVISDIALIDNECPVDAVTFSDSNTANPTVLSANLNQDDCAFSIETSANKAWSVQLILSDDSQIDVLFSNGSGLGSNAFYYTSDKDSEIDFGKIIFNSATQSAYVTNSPALQSDTDGDGIFDFSDTDDDGDGILDTLEADCDDDGIRDDWDLDSSCES